MKRLITGVALIAVSIYLIFWAPHVVFMAAALLMGLLCYSEYGGLVAGHGIPKPGVFGLVTGLLILFLPQATLIGVAMLIVIFSAVSLRRATLRGILPYLSCAVFGAFYAFAPWRFAADLRSVSVHLLFFALALNWIGDSAAYYVGRSFGKHRLAPIVSPKKSWEGAIASVLGSLVFGLIYLGFLLPAVPLWEVALMAVIGNIAGQFGDLTESAMKRGAGVKDSGALLPGHGGMLDRADSSMFALPVVYGIYLLIHITPYSFVLANR